MTESHYTGVTITNFNFNSSEHCEYGIHCMQCLYTVNRLSRQTSSPHDIAVEIKFRFLGNS